LNYCRTKVPLGMVDARGGHQRKHQMLVTPRPWV
jgi:hypothetical protein